MLVSTALDTTHGLCVRVTDEGVGISAEHITHVFDAFYQSDDSYIRKHPGSGLGLRLVRAMIELHDGEFGIESTPGAGTAVWFSLPAEHVQGFCQTNVATVEAAE